MACANKCEELEGLHEAAANFIAYSDLLDKWLNGGADETVSIGGVETQTVLGLYTTLTTLVKSLVRLKENGGLAYDDDEDDGGIYVVVKDLIAASSGLAVNDDGDLVLDLTTASGQELQTIILAICQEGGGLNVDENGQLYVDFDSMPTDKFEAMLKSIRVPIWLSATLQIYVDPENGVDDSDAGYGFSTALPFKTIPYALSFVTDNFNLGSYTCYINLMDGEYPSSSPTSTSQQLTLPKYNTGTGVIYLRAYNAGSYSNVVLHYRVILSSSAHYYLRDLTIQPVFLSTALANYNCLEISYAGRIDIQNVLIDGTLIEQATSSNRRSFVYVHDFGVLRIYATDSSSIPSGILFKNPNDFSNVLFYFVNGICEVSADITLIGSMVFNVFYDLQVLSAFRFLTSSYSNPGRAPTILVDDDAEFEGAQYYIYTNSILRIQSNTSRLIGSTEGDINTGGQLA